MISTTEAVVAFVVWCLVSFEVTLVTLGWPGVATFAPIWFLSTVYPFMKRIIPFPQVILGAVVGSAVFPGWISITQDADSLQKAIPLFIATAAWVVYFDVFYATQVNPTLGFPTAQVVLC
jgi:4-hydroxybenzoate polyprenyltransferase